MVSKNKTMDISSFRWWSCKYLAQLNHIMLLLYRNTAGCDHYQTKKKEKKRHCILKLLVFTSRCSLWCVWISGNELTRHVLFSRISRQKPSKLTGQSLEQKPLGEANSHSPRQEISCLVWNPKGLFNDVFIEAHSRVLNWTFVAWWWVINQMN
jgi:hypothetical protein